MSETAAKKKAPAKKAAAKKKSSKPKRAAKSKKKDEGEGEKSEERVAEVVSLGPSPQPWVIARHDFSARHRPARGFSEGELESAGINFETAKSFGVPLDIRRRSVREENSEKLKEWYKPAAKSLPEEPKAERAEKPKAKQGKKKKAAES